MKKHKDKNWLYEKYWRENHDLTSMAVAAGVSRMTIHNWMKRLGVPRRSRGNQQDIRLRSPGWLRARYWDDEMSQGEIGELTDSDHNAVCKRMAVLDIPTRSPNDHVDERLGDEEWLREKRDAGWSKQKIADEVNASWASVQYRLQKFGITE